MEADQVGGAYALEELLPDRHHAVDLATWEGNVKEPSNLAGGALLPENLGKDHTLVVMTPDNITLQTMLTGMGRQY